MTILQDASHCHDIIRGGSRGKYWSGAQCSGARKIFPGVGKFIGIASIFTLFLKKSSREAQTTK